MDLWRIINLFLAQLSQKEHTFVAESVHSLNFGISFQLSFLLQCLREGLDDDVGEGLSLPVLNLTARHLQQLAFRLSELSDQIALLLQQDSRVVFALFVD